MENYQEYLRVCETAVRAGGQVVQDWAGRFEVRQKGPADLVTQADLASQETVRKIVLEAFPTHSLLGEESTGQAPVPRTEYRWIVDPLDGTTNYVHGIPHYCVSLGLERNGHLLVGAVFNPSLNECFTAIDGQGAWLNGQPIHTTNVQLLSDSLAASGFPANVQPDSLDLRMFLEAMPHCQAIRRTGSSALNLCYLAAGRFELFWSYATHIWDVAAGVLIVREAGGLVTAPDGGEFSLESAKFLAAANPAILKQLEKLAKKIA